MKKSEKEPEQAPLKEPKQATEKEPEQATEKEPENVPKWPPLRDPMRGIKVYKREDILRRQKAREEKAKRSSAKKAGGPHAGHRARVRASFRATDGVGMLESQLLEMLLFYSIPRRNTFPIALSLLERFGSLDAVLHAPVKALMEVKGISTRSATLLRATQQFLDYAEREEVRCPKLRTTSEQVQYLREQTKPDPERVFLLSLDFVGNLLSLDSLQPSQPRDLTAGIVNCASRNHAAEMVLAVYRTEEPYQPTTEEMMEALDFEHTLALIRVRLRDVLFLTERYFVSLRSIRFLH